MMGAIGSSELVQLCFVVGLPTISVAASLIFILVQTRAIGKDIREIRSDVRLLTGKVYEPTAQK